MAPCLTRKRQLLAEFAGARVSLMLYLTQFFVEACVDMPTTTTGTLYHRFFAWPYEQPTPRQVGRVPRRGGNPGGACAVGWWGSVVGVGVVVGLVGL
ncbi:hypothetical protein HCB17_06460 [Salinispora arenicola]|nr:hypothetical protein [Salinispora arenicola]